LSSRPTRDGWRMSDHPLRRCAPMLGSYAATVPPRETLPGSALAETSRAAPRSPTTTPRRKPLHARHRLHYNYAADIPLTTRTDLPTILGLTASAPRLSQPRAAPARYGAAVPISRRTVSLVLQPVRSFDPTTSPRVDHFSYRQSSRTCGPRCIREEAPLSLERITTAPRIRS